jgi:hypothetical protein
VVEGGAVREDPVTRDPWEFQALCVDAFVASWRARGFSPVTIGNDSGELERVLTALGRPAWEVTAEDIDRVVGDLAVAGRATSTRRGYVQVFKGFHRFLEVRKAAEIEAAFGCGWRARSMSSTPPGMSAMIPRPSCRRRRRNA